MSEKLKCPRCGKRFKQANKKQVFCAECLAKERAARKNASQQVSSAGYSATGSPRHREDDGQSSGITIIQATPPPELGAYGAKARSAETTARQSPEHAPKPEATQPAKKPAAVTPPPKPAPPPQPVQKAPRPAKQSRPPRTSTPPFQLTDEMRTAIEQRYLELSQPVEFDGIRTQIATELNVPKAVVKQVVRDLRTSRQLPSWWELQAYKGSDEDLERIRQRYLPLLPIPSIGIHKHIAEELHMDAPQVYQAIRRLRAELKLPQYNPPESHTNETPPDASADGVPAGTRSSNRPQ